jgi:GNAT superfamily N-acetyltransferase
MTLSFRPCPFDEEPAASLVDAMRAEMASIYDGLNIDNSNMPKAGVDELGPPGGTFIVGYDEDDQPVCCGGIKRLPDGTCEIKRMYVVPSARDRGVARALLDALEAAARELRYSVARLDTGPRQPKAQRIYRNAGYRPIHNFNDNPVANFFGEKTLS